METFFVLGGPLLPRSEARTEADGMLGLFPLMLLLLLFLLSVSPEQ